MAKIIFDALALRYDGNNDLTLEEKELKILRKIMEDMEKGYNCGQIHDSKGRVIGRWEM